MLITNPVGQTFHVDLPELIERKDPEVATSTLYLASLVQRLIEMQPRALQHEMLSALLPPNYTLTITAPDAS